MERIVYLRLQWAEHCFIAVTRHDSTRHDGFYLLRLGVGSSEESLSLEESESEEESSEEDFSGGVSSEQIKHGVSHMLHLVLRQLIHIILIR